MVAPSCADSAATRGKGFLFAKPTTSELVRAGQPHGMSLKACWTAGSMAKHCSFVVVLFAGVRVAQFAQGAEEFG